MAARPIEAELAQNLRFLRWLADRVAQAATVSRRAQFARELARVLEARFAAIEEFVVPALASRGSGSALADAIPASASLRARLGTMGSAGAGDAPDDPARFLQLVIEHAELEQQVLVRLIERLLAPADALELGILFSEQLAAWPRTDSQWGTLDTPENGRSRPAELDE